MFAEIDLKRVDEQKPTELLATAGTPYRYKQVFGNDLLTMFANAETKQDGKTVYDIAFLPELCYIMANQAAKNDKTSLSGFYTWVDQFESFAFEEKAEEIINVYLGSMKTTSDVKKNNVQPKEK